MKEYITEETTTASEACLLHRIKELEDINHMMAHNLRGAASNIKLLSEILLDRYHEPANVPAAYDDQGTMSNEEIAGYINESSKALIDTLEDMMHTVNDDLKQRGEQCDVEHIVRNITGQLNGLLLQKKAKVILDLAIKKVKYARTYLESMLYNMINNSIKYARPGVPVEIRVTSRMYQGQPVIEVKDNGVGIDMQQHGDKIFKLHESCHKGYESTGVGLYMTQDQIEAKGGRIQVRSEINAGTEFTVTL